MRIDLTEKAILKLPLPPDGAGPRDYADSGVSQLVLAVRSTGTRSWTLRYRFGTGRERSQRRMTLGIWPETDVEEARERASAARKLIKNGIDPVAWEAEQLRLSEEKRRSENELSFARVAERFILRQKQKERRSWISQARTLGLRVQSVDVLGKPVLEIVAGGLADRWRDRPLASIGRLDVTCVLDALIDAGLPQAANMRLSILKSFFSWAVDQGYVNRSPVEKRKAPAESKTRDRVLSDAELRLLWLATEREHYPFRQFLRLLILTGQRRSEVAGLRFAELTGSDWTVPKERSKNKLAHKLPLSDAALAEIASTLRHMSGVAFTSNGRTPISGFSELKARLDARMSELAGQGVVIPAWTFHDVRRSVASGLASIGTAPHVIERVLNHRSGIISGVAGTYNRFDYHAEMREALQRWADHLAKIVGGEAQSTPVPSNVVAMRTA